MNTRTTKDLITELRAQALNADYFVLVVAFPNETKMVASTLSDAEALEELTVLVEQGGYPLDFIRSIRQGTRRSTEPRALPDFGDDPVPGRLLREMCERMADGLERQYAVYADRVQPQQEEDDMI